VIVGGCGADTLKGQAGNDTLCDSNGASLASGVCGCNSDGDDLMDGGDGKDTLWYEDTAYCSGGTLDANTSCGAHNEDSFGDITYWALPIDNTCEVLSSIPADCSFP
jgi:hypothetical protein